jgi:hypothetical protein
VKACGFASHSAAIDISEPWAGCTPSGLPTSWSALRVATTSSIDEEIVRGDGRTGSTLLIWLFQIKAALPPDSLRSVSSLLRSLRRSSLVSMLHDPPQSFVVSFLLRLRVV